MAIESDRMAPPERAAIGAGNVFGGAMRTLRQAAVGLRLAGRRLGGALSNVPVDRFFTSLARRIFVANLVGLLILMAGIAYYFNEYKGKLIETKTESLKVQSQIIAAAMAANAKIEGRDGITLDPNKLPNVENARIPFRDDAFAALELSLSPENVTPILKRLIKPINTRARIYSREYSLIFDSDQMLAHQVYEPNGSRRADQQDGTGAAPARPGGQQAPLRGFWTWLNTRFAPTDLPFYYEIDSAKGGRYKQVRAAMKSGKPSEILLISEKGRQLIVWAITPIKRFNTVHGVLLLSTPPGEIDEILGDQRRLILIASLLALLATVGASIILTRTISRPMKRLSAAAEHVRHNINARTELPEFPNRTDEVGQLAVAFGDMTAALYRRAEASEKFASDVAHELKNPLTAATATAESLTYAKTDEQREERVQQIRNELLRLNRLITDVANASKLDAELALQEAEPVDMRGVLRDVTGVFNDVPGSNGCKVVLDIPQLPKMANDLVVAGHEGRFSQVITNLVDNALSFSPAAGIVTVSARRIGPELELRVEDQGAGIPGDMLERIFQRFYSDRPATEFKRGKNSGLGLSISREIINAHKGRIWAENRGTPLLPLSRAASAQCETRAGDGTAFIIRLPAAYPSRYKGRLRNGRWK